MTLSYIVRPCRCAGCVVRDALLLPSLSLYIIPIFFEKTSVFYFLNDSVYLPEPLFWTRQLSRDREKP
jgi:hypothetical protein